ncbi:ABC transporter permease [Solibacillus sp. MA9]|uniref:ABC transporter permease n=1 Tax=Solibacillus palustris TaxID=2908203 RepID=A0ABS9UH69_9BACL|nr:ABC transporter permease [Solibacillus sp. MA9]MCH7323578.1 ABC transporter permease [Solibacillus sp. MA9]
MKLSQLVLKSMQKNMRHYYLYFFALIFSVTLFFSFVTLQYNESIIEATKASGTASAGFEAASYMLYFIVLFFVLYANHLFIKRRSKEIGLYQLIGMTKGLVTRLIAFENILLFAGAVSIGMMLGLLSSRLFTMILLKLLQFDAVVTMSFSKVAVINTLIVFGILLVIILLQMAFMVRKTTLLSLFNASKQADERVKRFSVFPMLMGAVGIGLIVYGYYESTVLLSAETKNLFLSMLLILATTIGGTYFVFRYSVAFVLNLFRLSKKGHLNLTDVLALTPIMHRMKSNAKSLTLITVLTAVSLAITTLSYISYYSASSSAEERVPADYVTVDGREAAFLTALDAQEIAYTTKTMNLTSAQVDLAEIFDKKSIELFGDNTLGNTLVISLSDYQQIDPTLHLAAGEAILTSYNGFMSNLIPIVAPLELTLLHGEHQFPIHIKRIDEESILAWRITSGGFVIVAEDAVFKELQQLNEGESFGYVTKSQTTVDLVDANEETYEQVEKLYKTTGANIFRESQEDGQIRKLSSQQTEVKENLNMFGTTIFTTAFLGLAFLLATGSILYFKQMSEADEEAESYKILRKIGFTQDELLRGIMMKQVFNFGVPLVIGLLHSYFAVKSGWFLFGTEMTTPLLITMALYISMYILFAALTINYYKKIIKQAL